MRNNQYSEALAPLHFGSKSEAISLYGGILSATAGHRLPPSWGITMKLLPQAEQAITGFEGVGATESASLSVMKLASDLAGLHRDEAYDKARALLTTRWSRSRPRRRHLCD